MIVISGYMIRIANPWLLSREQSYPIKIAWMTYAKNKTITFNGRNTDYFVVRLRRLPWHMLWRYSSFAAVPFQEKSVRSLFEEETLLCYLLPRRRWILWKPKIIDTKPILVLIARSEQFKRWFK